MRVNVDRGIWVSECFYDMGSLGVRYSTWTISLSGAVTTPRFITRTVVRAREFGIQGLRAKKGRPSRCFVEQAWERRVRERL